MRNGFLSLRKLGSGGSRDEKIAGAPRLAHKEEEGREYGYELNLPTASPNTSPHHGRILLLSYEEFQSSQQNPYHPSQNSSFLGYRPLTPPFNPSSHIALEENLVDTPPSPEIEIHSKSWECSQCTLFNDLDITSCIACDYSRPGSKKNTKIVAPEVSRREVEIASEEEPDGSSESASGSEWDDEEDDGSDVPDLGSEEGSGDEGGKKNVEDIFMQCLPPDTRSKGLSAKSHEIVDLTDLETSDRGHSSSASSSHRLMQPTPFVEDIEDFEEEDSGNVPSSYPYLEHFRTVKDLRRSGYDVIDFSKFILSSTPSSRTKSTSHYDARREKRDNDSQKKKKRKAPSSSSKKGSWKRSSKSRNS